MAKVVKVLLLPGDGVGKEVVSEARRILEVVQQLTQSKRVVFHFDEALIGGSAIDATGDPLPAETLTKARQSDFILLGAVGGPKWATSSPRPEEGLLRIRKELGLFANLRPVFLASPSLAAASPLREAIVRGVDIMFVRELTGGIYFGPSKEEDENGTAFDTEVYSIAEIERVARVAASLALSRRSKITSIDKANVLASSRLWRKTVTRVVKEEFPSLQLDHQLVDSAAMILITRPSQWDVVLCPNLFGDILTDEAAALPGSLGLLPSASLGMPGEPGLYEPIHGSAPDIAGQGIANPIGTILSAAMALRHSVGMNDLAVAIETAVASALEKGGKTKDLLSVIGAGEKALSTSEMTNAIIAHLSL